MNNMDMNNQALTLINDETGENFVAELTERTTMFCSLKPVDAKGKATLFKAMNNPEKRIGDCINMVIEAKDLFCEVVTCTNSETGETTQCPRIVIIDKNGVGYQAVSLGIFSAVRKIIQVFGQPTWSDVIKLKVVQITKGEKKILTFDVV